MTRNEWPAGLDRDVDLKGKYLTIKVDDDNARVFFDLPRESGKAGKQWVFGGRIEGETEGVGVWMTIEDVTTPEGMVMPAPGPYTMLIRWDWILTAVATADKPAN
jgi:hypothetical protein